jgi:primosomal protein N' (replication factor Y)
MDRGYNACPDCGSPDVMYVGAGTQRVEETIPRLFDGAVAVRLDSDAAGGKKRLHEILTDFAGGKSNLLLGTQMVTKGLDLPGVTLVGVLSADLMLDFPDFRASERTFAQLLQVAGRSGRAEKTGEVLIQTYYPENTVIAHAAAQHYRAFYDEEIRHREDLGYPPFSRIVNFVFSGKDEHKVQSEADRFRDGFESLMGKHRLQASVLGPAPCPMYYLRGLYRRHLFVKTGRIQALTRALTAWEESESRFGVASTVKITVDVDPDDMM